MPTIEKLQSGFIYKENFSEENIMWQFFPNEPSRYTKANNSLIFNYCTSRSVALTKMPDGDFVMQCKVTHRPLSTNSFAGVLLLESNDDWVECQLYKDDAVLTQHFYNYIKVVRTGYNFYFYASMDNIAWEIIGSMAYPDCIMFGFYFETDDIADSFTVENVIFYKSPAITLNSTLNGHVVQLKNQSNYIIATTKVSNGKANFDLTTMSLPLLNHSLTLLDFGYTISSLPMNIYGGDTFGYNYNLNLKCNGVDVVPNEMVDLGRIYDDTQTLITIENLDVNYDIPNLTLRIEQYSPYDYAAKNVEMIPSIHDDTAVWSKEIVIPLLKSHEPFDILIRIDKETDVPTLFKTTGFRYKIVIE